VKRVVAMRSSHGDHCPPNDPGPAGLIAAMDFSTIGRRDVTMSPVTLRVWPGKTTPAASQASGSTPT
jgi:hypothetical protein